MEPPTGAIPPDRDRDKYLPNSMNQLTPAAASTIGIPSTVQQQPIERLSRPMAFDKVCTILLFMLVFFYILFLFLGVVVFKFNSKKKKKIVICLGWDFIISNIKISI